MLAQNFKTAVDLGINDLELDALIKVLGMLERGELVDAHPYKPTVPNGFNMTWVHHGTDCGTVGCIMGWCGMVTNNDKLFFNYFDGGKRRPPYLGDLFMFANERRYGVTVEQAATALRSYLSTGDANWADALAVGE